MELEIGAGEDADAAELDALTSGLRRELLELDVDEVKRADAGEAPEGARAVDAAAIGTLVVTLANPIFGAVAAVVSSWLSRSGSRSLKMTLDGDTIEISGGVSSDERERLIGAWVARHAQR
jgi:hypothetical protein